METSEEQVRQTDADELIRYLMDRCDDIIRHSGVLRELLRDEDVYNWLVGPEGIQQEPSSGGPPRWRSQGLDLGHKLNLVQSQLADVWDADGPRRLHDTPADDD